MLRNPEAEHMIRGPTSKFLRYIGSSRVSKSDLEDKMGEFLKGGNSIIFEGTKVYVEVFPVGEEIIQIFTESGSKITGVGNGYCTPKHRYTISGPDGIKVLVESNQVKYNVSYEPRE